MATRANVFIATAQDKHSALRNALIGAGMLDDLSQRCATSGKGPAEFRVVIKTDPGVEGFAPATDPDLVAQVVQELRDAGYTAATAIAHGGDDLVVSHDFGSVLGRRPVSLAWHDADYRISFAACRTDPRCFYATTIANVLDCLPTQFGAGSATFYERAALVADRLPIHFALLDAWVSHDGLGNRPNQTHTIIASPHPLGVDWVAGEKMGLDPALNLVVQEALHRWGRIELVRRGNQTPWEPWRNVRPLLVFLRAWTDPLGERTGSQWLARVFRPGITRRAPAASRQRRVVA